MRQSLSKSDVMDSTTTATTFKPRNNLYKIVITEPQVKFNDKLNMFDNYCVLSSHHASMSFLKSKAQVSVFLGARGVWAPCIGCHVDFKTYSPQTSSFFKIKDGGSMRSQLHLRNLPDFNVRTPCDYIS